MKKIKLMQENEEYIPVALQRFAGIYKPKVKKEKNEIGFLEEAGFLDEYGNQD